LDIWRRSGKTVVFVTHGLHEALALSTRVVVMTARPGRVKSVLDLPYPYPRAMDGLDMVELRAKLWNEIRDEALPATGERYPQSMSPRAQNAMAERRARRVPDSMSER